MQLSNPISTQPNLCHYRILTEPRTARLYFLVAFHGDSTFQISISCMTLMLVTNLRTLYLIRENVLNVPSELLTIVFMTTDCVSPYCVLIVINFTPGKDFPTRPPLAAGSPYSDSCLYYFRLLVSNRLLVLYYINLV